jgi:hypothetical protein
MESPKLTKKLFKKTSIIILMVFCVLSFIWFVDSFNKFHKNGELDFNPHIKNHRDFNHNKYTVNDIGTWMTFDYINFTFKLPPDYLRNYMKIKDSRYPNIKVGHYIKENNLDPLVFMLEIKQAITIYPYNK